jgi:hypothetical protein
MLEKLRLNRESKEWKGKNLKKIIWLLLIWILSKEWVGKELTLELRKCGICCE